MIGNVLRKSKKRRSRPAIFAVAALLASLIAAPRLFADEPYARSRDYDLANSGFA